MDDENFEDTSCWACMGAGAWHDCGEDCCSCIDKSLNEYCDVCDGEGVLGNWYSLPPMPKEKETL